MTATSFKKNKIACALYSALAILVPVSGLIASNSVWAEKTTIEYTSETQSLWHKFDDNGEVVSNLDISAELFNLNWNKQFKVGGIADLGLFGDWGAKVWGGTSGEISTKYTAGFNGGEFSLTSPVDVEIFLPTEINKGFTYSVATSAIFDSDAGITVVNPKSAYFKLDMNTSIQGSLSAKACAASQCVGGNIVNLNVSKSSNIMDLTAGTDSELSIPIYGLTKEKLAKSATGTALEFGDGAIKLTFGTPSFRSEIIEDIVNSRRDKNQKATGTFTSSIIDPLDTPFIELEIDLDNIITKASGGTIRFKGGSPIPGLTAKFDLLDVDLVTAMAFTQDLKVESKVVAVLTASEMVLNPAYDPNKPTDFSNPDNPNPMYISNDRFKNYEFIAGEEIKLLIPEGQYSHLNFSTKYQLVNSITSSAGLLFSSSIEVNALSYTVDAFGIKKKGKPVFKADENLLETPAELHSKSWTLMSDEVTENQTAASTIVAKVNSITPKDLFLMEDKTFNEDYVNYAPISIFPSIGSSGVTVTNNATMKNYEQIYVGGAGAEFINNGHIEGLAYNRTQEQLRYNSLQARAGGKIINNGVIQLKVANAEIRIERDGELFNSHLGSIWATAKDSKVINNGGKFTNDGYMLVNNLDNRENSEFINGRLLLIDNSFKNSGNFTNTKAKWISGYTEQSTPIYTTTNGLVDIIGESINYASGVITNEEKFKIDGAFVNKGVVINKKSMETLQTFTNHNLVTNQGMFINKAQANLINEGEYRNKSGGTLHNQGTLTNHVYLVNEQGSTIKNDGVMTNQSLNNTAAIIENSGTFNINETGYVENATADALLQNKSTGNILLAGQLVNKGNIENDGVIDITDTGSLFNEGKYFGNGSTENAGTLINYGEFEQENSDFINKEKATLANLYGGDFRTRNMDNQGEIINRGLMSTNNFNNSSDGSMLNMNALTIKGQFNNNGDFSNKDIISLNGLEAEKAGNSIVLPSAVVTILGTGINSSNGIIENSATMNINNFNNYGNINNQGTINSNDLFWNRTSGVLNNLGTFNVSKNGYFYNDGQVTNNGVFDNQEKFYNVRNFVNKGLFINQRTFDSGGVTASFSQTEDGILNNQQTGTMTFKNDTLLAGLVVNNGLINIANEQVLTMTGNLSGSGTFTGETLLDGTQVNPGNSPGTLTFNGDTTWDNVDLTMEVASAVGGGFDFDTINILGNLTLLSAFTISFDFLDGLDISELLGESFNFLNISGDVLDENSQAINLADWTIALIDGWATNWFQGADNSWQLALSYNGIILDPTDVPEPTTLLLFLLAGGALLYRRSNTSVSNKSALDSLSPLIC